jgi:hypothetical protein
MMEVDRLAMIDELAAAEKINSSYVSRRTDLWFRCINPRLT